MSRWLWPHTECRTILRFLGGFRKQSIDELYIFYYGNNMNNMKSYKTFSFTRNYTCLLNTLASLVPLMVKNPPAMQDTWV